MKKGIITIAIGKKHNKMAKYLGYSCILHSPSLPRAIITDNCNYFKGIYDITIQYKEEMGNPFNIKTSLHNYSPFYETLYIDADCLVYTDLNFMWDYFENQSIVYRGQCAKEGYWYHQDISNFCKFANIEWVGKLNSGIFLFRKDEIGINTLNYANDLYNNHEGINIPLFRGKHLPDEPFLAIAFGKFNQIPVSYNNNYGRLGYELLNSRKIKLDITKGISRFTEREDSFRGEEIVFPSIVHFKTRSLIKNIYSLEKLSLLFYYKGIPGCFIISFLSCSFTFFYNIYKAIKNK